MNVYHNLGDKKGKIVWREREGGDSTSWCRMAGKGLSEFSIKLRPKWNKEEEWGCLGGKRFRSSGKVQRWVSLRCPWSGRKPVWLEWREPEGSTGCNAGEEMGLDHAGFVARWQLWVSALQLEVTGSCGQGVTRSYWCFRRIFLAVLWKIDCRGVKWRLLQVVQGRDVDPVWWWRGWRDAAGFWMNQLGRVDGTWIQKMGEKDKSRMIQLVLIWATRRMTPPLWQKVKGTKKPLDESERGEWKSWLKAQHSENEDHEIWSHHLMGNRWGNSGNSVRLYFWGLQNHCTWWLQPWN